MISGKSDGGEVKKGGSQGLSGNIFRQPLFIIMKKNHLSLQRLSDRTDLFLDEEGAPPLFIPVFLSETLLFDQAGMYLRFFMIIHARQDQLAAEPFQHGWIIPIPDLRNGA